jgi:hypothetical protein
LTRKPTWLKELKPAVPISHASSIVRSLIALRPSNANVGPKNPMDYKTTIFLVSFLWGHLNKYWIL